MRSGLLAVLFLGSGCAPSVAPASDPTPERVLVVGPDGREIRQSTGAERSRVTFPASMDKTWRALVLSYAAAGIEPTISDPAAGRYGSDAYAVPRQVMGRPIGQFFECGSSLTGATVNAGRVTAVVVTTLSPLPDGTTGATTRVTGTVRRSDGSSGEPIQCSSTGALEEYLAPRR